MICIPPDFRGVNVLLAEYGPARRQRWPGHLPVTRACLTMILERVVLGDAEFTLGERALVTSCEFWALTMAGELHSHTDARALRMIRYAGMVFDSIGVVGVASVLKAAHPDLIGTQSQLRRRKRLKMLEAELWQTTEPVDELLARFAEQLNSTQSMVHRPGIQPGRGVRVESSRSAEADQGNRL
jgi:hypothetical protein